MALMQMSPVGHGAAQAPQLAPLLLRSTHAPLQSVWPCRQPQAPATQNVLPVHAVAHLPQLALSICGLVQTPPLFVLE